MIDHPTMWRVLDDEAPAIDALIRLEGRVGLWVYEGTTTGGNHWVRRPCAKDGIPVRGIGRYWPGRPHPTPLDDDAPSE